jgi:hypothetical protein
MSLTIKRIGMDLQVLSGAETLPEGEEVVLFTADELSSLQLERLELLNLQMPSFLCGGEDSDVADLIAL